jgi:membrane-associated phospholipid phosphatase
VRLSALVFVVAVAASPLGAQSDAPRAPTRFGWTHLAAAGAGVALATLFDAPVARAIDRADSPGLQRAAQRLDYFGEGPMLAIGLGGLALAGQIADAPGLTRTAAQGAMAVATATAITFAGKYTLGRARPYQDPGLDGDRFAPLSGKVSLPSGHTAAAFALATSLGDASGSGVVKGLLYTAAAGTGFARIAQHKHWFGDVVAGALIGVTSARFANGRATIFGLKAPPVVTGPSGPGLGWQMSLPPIR